MDRKLHVMALAGILFLFLIHTRRALARRTRRALISRTPREKVLAPLPFVRRRMGWS